MPVAAVLTFAVAAASASAGALEAPVAARIDAVEQRWGLPFFFGGGEATTTSPPPLRHHCRSGTGSHEDSAGWSRAKRDWCCSHADVGCHGVAPFNCSGNTSHAQQNRSRTQVEIDWCCNVAGLGCADAGATFDCRSSPASTWTETQTKWCCERWGRGCPGRDNTTAAAAGALHDRTSGGGKSPFNCVVGFSQWEKVWSPEKRKDCCKRFARGCTPSAGTKPTPPLTTTTATTTKREHFHCSDGSDVATWSLRRRMHCCSAAGTGCVSGPEEAAGDNNGAVVYDCGNHVAPGWRWAWSGEKRRWCCAHHGVGCGEDNGPKDVFDCVTGFEDWRVKWSVAKRSWCCEHARRGCVRHSRPDKPPVPEEPDEPEGPEELEEPEQPEQTEQPKVTQAPAVPGAPETTSLPYDCGRGLVRSWPNGKKAWCCMRVGRGCAVVPPPPPPTRTSTAAPTTTTTGRPTSTETTTSTTDTTTSTSTSRTTTTRLLIFTPSPRADLYDCKLDFENWLMLWDTAKRRWCCQHEPALTGHAMCFPVQGKFGNEAAPQAAAPPLRLGVGATAAVVLGAGAVLAVALAFVRGSVVSQTVARSVATVSPEEFSVRRELEQIILASESDDSDAEDRGVS